MLLDFDLPETPAPTHSEVCIIGAGAAGILLATQLAAAGRRVTLLEGGGKLQEAASQEIYHSEVTGLPHQGIHTGRFRTYGGSTTQWGGQILELDAFDFEPRAHVEGSGWPFPKSTLTDFYERALAFEGLRRVARDDGKIRASLGLGPCNPGAEFALRYSRWTPERNFATLQARALTSSRRLSVHVHASVVGFVLNDAGTAVTAARVRGFSGRQALVTADQFVICMGGIESTRLLLQPLAQGAAPWQVTGMVGRHYQDHVALNGIPIRDVACKPVHLHFGDITVGGFRYHSKIQLQQSEQLAAKTLNAAGTIVPTRAPDPDRDRAVNTIREMVRQRRRPSTSEGLNAARHLPAFAVKVLGQRLLSEEAEWKETMLRVDCEQLPLSASTITLAEERDALGLLRTRLDWKTSAEELHTVRTYVRTAVSAFARQGFARVEPPKGFFEDDDVVRAMINDSSHHMGGTRMSTAPAGGVVDPDLKLHGIANAYVCSSSVFPSSGFSNPTHTLLALAMRLSDHLEVETGKTVEQSTRGVLPAPVATAPMRKVTLPGVAKSLPQLGFGCAYLLGPGLDRLKSRRLLDTAYDAGIRHFDVARLYGAGATEGLIGEFLRDNPDATVTTKYGVVPPNPAWRVVQVLQRRVPGLSATTRYVKRNDKARFDAKDARASLDLSLRLLGRDHIELFLMHEPDVRDLVHDDLLAFLEQQRRAGRIGNFGIGGEYHRMEGFVRERPGYAPILQFEASVFGPKLDIGGASRIHYRTFARPAEALGRRFEKDDALAQRWSEAVNADLREPITLSRLLLKASLDAFPDALTLFSTRSEEHVFENAQVGADSRLVEPARKLLELVRADDLGLGAELYRVNR